ncbi:type I restriction endonuclease [Marinitoga aeolica]|uniref:Type I restriction enzyme HsdR N-terminal domain-containing protein n=1 Tax=Marinitoga aeolica TaxID=2809031 RepID=A0ABY8PPU3_9BACT|nr:type I restriction endonuclease [Marinitoga aeolica]WGS64655.1 type I restriction enzyme HsdR N-terminal domain-containing protein [Marinitoga aeolica]
MELFEELKKLAKKVEDLKDKVQNNEEATKTAFIMPFFELLGYDTRNPLEFVPEYTADIANKKGEKVDYAILIDEEPQILIEAKACNEKLDKHDAQLMRYFNVTNAKIAILTNGIIYKFFTDLDEPNKMDERPFLEINILDLKEAQIAELNKFSKNNFDSEKIMVSAENLKYSNAIKNYIKRQFDNPDDDFVKLILSQIYNGQKTKKAIEKFKDPIKKALNQILNELVRNRLEDALKNNSKEEKEENLEEDNTEEVSDDVNSGIVTTEEELQAFYMIQGILTEFVDDPERISYKDTKSYFGILLDGKVTNWICRLVLKSNSKFIIFPKNKSDESGNKEGEKIKIEKLSEIYSLKDKFIESLKNLL